MLRDAWHFLALPNLCLEARLSLIWSTVHAPATLVTMNNNEPEAEPECVQEYSLEDVCYTIATLPELSFQAKCFLLLAAQVPWGRYATYHSIMETYSLKYGMASVQNVGRALRKNPFPPVLPCHRVVAANGGIGRYYTDWGHHVTDVEYNQALLAEEGVRFDKNGRILGGQMYPHEFSWDTPVLLERQETQRQGESLDLCVLR